MLVSISTKNYIGNYNCETIRFNKEENLNAYLRAIIASSSKLIGYEILT